MRSSAACPFVIVTLQSSTMAAINCASGRRRVDDLTLLSFLKVLQERDLGAEPTVGELRKALMEDRQPYPIRVAGSTVLFGAALMEAAQACHKETVKVQGCEDCKDLNEADL